jgi:hypothetical protein
MSALGQKQTSRRVGGMSAFGPEGDILAARVAANVTSVLCSRLQRDIDAAVVDSLKPLDPSRPIREADIGLFNHLVGTGEQRGRDSYADYPCGLRVDDQLELAGLHDG